MTTIDPGMEALLETFVYESNTMLEQLDEIMLESERAQNISHENIDSIFRIMHTVKGSAAMMGFNGISGLAHSVEDIFFIIRETPEKLGIVFNALFDLVFQTSDFLKREIEKIQNGDFEESDPGALVALLHQQAAIMKGEEAPAESPIPATAGAAAAAEKTVEGAEDFHKVRVYFEDDCQMENMRAFMLLNQISHCCDAIESVPANPEADSSLCADIIRDGFLILFKPTETFDDVIKIIESSLNVKSYEVIRDEAAPPAKESAGPAAAGPGEAKTGTAPSGGSGGQTPSPGGKSGSIQSLISVNQVKLDQLMDLVGELVTAESIVASNPDLKGLKLDNFHKSTREMRKLTDELQDVVMSIRMVPLTATFQKMNRIVRDMCKKLDKKVELVTYGGETEVDKTINDSIADPFMHMIRNAIDHAIESPEERRALGKPEIGTVTLNARNAGGEILIDVADDGRGLDPEVLLNKARNNGLLIKPESEYTEKEIYQLIMMPGFSTNTEVTEYSGRGVGMDVVRKNVEKVGGSISIHSARNEGTTFTIKIPLTLAIVDGMNISVGSTVFTLPITSIKQSFKISDAKQVLYNTDGAEMILLRGDCYPIIRLHDLFGIDTEKQDMMEGIMIQVESANTIAVLFADELLGEYQVVVKPFPTFFNKYSLKEQGLSGCSILGDGSISLILDVGNLMSAQ
ncbi:MAG: chemotaxis protein CheA [Peptococcaceae bacterium]|jgi:two-component system chemotaxis sensor kinase CheA|nr:chemotaxis protein CheA [Peptococcaceae bacterium]